MRITKSEIQEALKSSDFIPYVKTLAKFDGPDYREDSIPAIALKVLATWNYFVKLQDEPRPMTREEFETYRLAEAQALASYQQARYALETAVANRLME